MSESPRTWTLIGTGPSGANRWLRASIGGVNPPMLEAGEQVVVGELGPLLDTLEELVHATCTDRAPMVAEMAESLLREHGRLG